MPTFVLRLIAPRPNFAQTMNDAEREIMNRHAAHWRPYLERGDMELEEKLNQLVDFLAHLEIPWQANDGVERLSLPQIRAICLFLDFASEQLIAEADEAARAATVWRKAWEILARGGLAEHAPPYKLE